MAAWHGDRSSHHLLQLGSINLSVLKGFIETGPLPLKARRERQFRKGVGRALRQQGIHRVEQGIGRYAALFGPSVVYEFLSPLGAGVAVLLGLLSFVWVVYLLIDTARSPTKQGFHDRFANSLVVKVTRAPT